MALAALAAVLVLLALPSPAGAKGEFRVSFDPPLERTVAQAGPDSAKTPSAITVEALDADGRPVRDALIDVTLTAPSFGPFLGSDLPRVEGRTLLRMRVGAPDGRHTFRYVLPLRGEYRLDLRAEPAPGSGARFEPVATRTSFEVAERSGELLKLLALLAGLFAFGLLSARVIGRSHLERRRRTAAGGGVRSELLPAMVLLGALGAVLIGALVVQEVRDQRANADDRPSGGEGQTVTMRGSDAELRFSLDRSRAEGATAETLVGGRAELTDAATGRAEPAVYTLRARELESGHTVFETTAPAPAGGVVWHQTFWDGVEHELAVSARPAGGGEAVEARTRLEVHAMSPPLETKLFGLAGLLGALVLGMTAGLFLARRRVA